MRENIWSPYFSKISYNTWHNLVDLLVVGGCTYQTKASEGLGLSVSMDTRAITWRGSNLESIDKTSNYIDDRFLINIEKIDVHTHRLQTTLLWNNLTRVSRDQTRHITVRFWFRNIAIFWQQAGHVTRQYTVCCEYVQNVVTAWE